jgi:spermidine/putrescine transport system ATP-binding protein
VIKDVQGVEARVDTIGEAEEMRSERKVAVELVELERRFDDLVAVDSLDLAVFDNEFFSLIGPSGCGKTTTLRMIAGLETPTKGRVIVHRRDMTRVPACRRPVNTVFQHYALFPHLDVFENVAFGLRERRVGRREVRRRVAEMLELVNLSGRERARPKQLSGGQQQRVALARALVLEPEVLLLDEPLGALDLKLRKQMQVLLKRVQREVGITFIYVTHDQEEAFSMSDRVAIMNLGVLEQVGDPREVYERPQTLFVADFVGASNRFLGRIEAFLGDRTYRATIDGLGTVEAGGAEGLGERESVVAIVRPEAVLMNGPEDDRLSVDARVLDVSYLGPHVLYSIDAGTLGTLSVLVNSQADRSSAGPGSEARFVWRPADMWLVPEAGSSKAARGYG